MTRWPECRKPPGRPRTCGSSWSRRWRCRVCTSTATTFTCSATGSTSKRSPQPASAPSMSGAASPYWDGKDPDQVETLMGGLAVEGVEGFYPEHSREQTEHLLRICTDRGLVPTGSSDFHGPTHKPFSRFGAYQTYGLGEPEVPA